MHPDLLSAQEEEKQPEPFDAAPELPQPAPLSADALSTPKPSPVAVKKRFRVSPAAIGLGLLVALLLAAFAWVGYWAFTLNNELTATQQAFSALQAEHASLQADYAALTGEHDKLNAELDQTRADLEKANTDLAAAQAELEQAKEQVNRLESKIDMAGKLAEILYAWTTTDEPSDILRIDTLIKETDNQQLISQWNAFADSPSDDAFGVFMEYLITAIRNSVR